MSTPRYPITVQLSGEDGNAFAILGRVKKAIEKHVMSEGMTAAEARVIGREFFDAATAGDYDNLLRVCCEWVDAQ